MKIHMPDNNLGWFCMAPTKRGKPPCLASGPERGDAAPNLCPVCGGSPVAVRSEPERGEAGDKTAKAYPPLNQNSTEK